jgi:hypothetical protein
MLALLGLLPFLAAPPQAVGGLGVQALGARSIADDADAADAEAYLKIYEASVRAERENDLFLAWQAADPERRRRAAGVLADLRSTGAPSEWRPDLGSIGVATAVLGGADLESWIGEIPSAVLAVQAMSIDLVVQPGLFAPTPEGERSANLTVVVAPLFDLREALDVTARLYWIAPDGTETLAREEPVAGKVFEKGRTGAFKMFIRAPQGPRGLWRLQMELEPTFAFIEDGTKGAPVGTLLLEPVRTRPAWVPCIESEERAEEVDMTLGEAFLARMGLALPPYIDGLASEWLADLAAGRETSPRPLSPAARESHVGLVWAAPKDIAPGPCLAGEVGRRWREEVPAHLFVLRSSDPSGQSGAVHAALDEAGQLAGDGAARVLVLDGDALVGAQLEALVKGPYTLDALVVIAQSWRPTSTLPAVPTLFLTPDADAAALAERLGEGRVDAEVLDFSTFLASLEVPGHVAAFLERRAIGVDLRGGL